MSAPAPAGRAVLLEPLRWWDIRQVVALEQQLFPQDSPWTAAMFWAELAGGHHYVVHRDADGIAGYAGLAATAQEAGVQTIGVRPDAWGRGIGWALLTDLLRQAAERRVLLEVRTDNLRAQNLYRRAGFTTIGLRRGYYSPSGADAYVMSREPQPSARSAGPAA